MDPVTIVATVITFAGAVCTSYEQISKVVGVVQNAPNELAAIRSQAASINDVVADLKQTIEESDIREAIEKDKRALDHVEKLNRPLKEVQCTLTEVVDKLTNQTRPTTEEGHYKLRWRYYFSTSEWEQLQKRLTAHINVLNISMQGLLTFHVLLALGDRNRDPARTLRAYAKSIIEGQEVGELTSVDERKPSPLASSNNTPPFPLPLDERRVLLRRKRGLQRDLLQASQRGDEFEVSLLLGEGAETDWTDENGGMTALHIAARYGHIHAAECLLEAGADIEAKSDAIGNEWTVRSEKDRTPLIWAATGRDCPRMQERMCRFLLDKGANVNARNVSGRTPLQEAAMSVRYNIDPRPTMQTLIGCGALVNAYDMEGWTALTESAFHGQKGMVELLLANGAQVDGKPGKDDPATNSNPNLKGKHCETPLVVCTHWSWNEEVIGLLLDRGADMESRNGQGKTIAELAADAKRGTTLDKLAEMDKS